MMRFVPHLGSLGLGLLLAGLALRLFQPGRESIWQSFLVTGLILSLFYLFTHWQHIMIFARRRSSRYGANASFLSIIVVSIIIAINWISFGHEKRWDFTATRQYSLSDQTIKILGDLNSKLELVLFDDPTQAASTVDLLRLYRDFSNWVSYELIDPEANPARALAFQTEAEAQIPMGTLMIDFRDRRERVSSITEHNITNSLIRLLGEGTKKVYFTAGHQEKELNNSEGNGLSEVTKRLEDSRYDVESVVLLQSIVDGHVSIPDDSSAIVVAGPRIDFLAPEIDVLRNYLLNGGSAIVLLDPREQASVPNLEALMVEIGITLTDDFVVDASPVGQLLGYGPVVPLVIDYGEHVITEGFGDAPSMFPLVRSLTVAEDRPSNIAPTMLLQSSPASWSETSFDELASGEVIFDDTDLKGPLDLSVALTIDVETDSENGGVGITGDSIEEEISTIEGRMVVVGDSDFITNNPVMSPNRNSDLFINMVNWVTQEENLIAIRPRRAEDRRITLNQQQETNILFLSVIMLPLVVLFFGFSIWWSRR